MVYWFWIFFSGSVHEHALERSRLKILDWWLFLIFQNVPLLVFVLISCAVVDLGSTDCWILQEMVDFLVDIWHDEGLFD